MPSLEPLLGTETRAEAAATAVRAAVVAALAGPNSSSTSNFSREEDGALFDELDQSSPFVSDPHDDISLSSLRSGSSLPSLESYEASEREQELESDFA